MISIKGVLLKIAIAVGLHLLLFQTLTNAQSLSELETEYLKLLNDYQANVDLLDTTMKIYSEEIILIGNEKKKNDRDESRIAKLMSESVVTSNKLDSLQNVFESIKETINSRKELLNNLYSQKIDSLKHLENDKNFEGSRAELNVEILTLIEKRLLVRPQISTLSYNPKEIVKITSTSLQDTTSRIIVKDYLQSALQEVNMQIDQIAKMTERIEEVLSLQQKVDDFIEDAGMQTHISRFSSSSLYSANKEELRSYPGAEVGNNLDFAADAINIIPQARTFTLLFDQLNITDNFTHPNSGKWNQYLNSATGFIPLKDYLAILDEIEYRLKMYKEILEKKLSE